MCNECCNQENYRAHIKGCRKLNVHSIVNKTWWELDPVDAKLIHYVDILDNQRTYEASSSTKSTFT